MGNEYRELWQLRESGHVRRFHTVPHTLPQTVADHSAQCLTLLFMLHPSPGLALIKAMLWHDAAERHTGDVPAPVKLHQPEYGLAIRKAEDEVIGREFQTLDTLALSTDDCRWLKAIDTLELVLWARDQQKLGNIHFRELEKRGLSWLNSGGTPEPIRLFMRTFEGYDLESIA